jgi:hypothetical protein
MTIWTAGSTSLNGSGSYRDGISRGQWTADGSTDNYRDHSDLTEPSHGPQGFRGFPTAAYTPRNDLSFPSGPRDPK